MSVDEFWHGDKRLFKVYQKAYYNRLYNNAWVIGSHIDLSIHNQLINTINYLFDGFKKGAKFLKYPDKPLNPFEDNEKQPSQEDFENDYRELIENQEDWLENIMKK